MKVTYLGTGAAEGVPAVFCDCPTCNKIRARGEAEYHTRAQFMVDDCIGIDFPPDAYAHSLMFGADYRKMRYLLVTHSHMDHFYAQDFILRGYKYTSPLNEPLTIYGNRDVIEVFKEGTRRELKAEVAEGLSVQEIAPFVPFKAKDYEVTALVANHGKTPAFVYLVEREGHAYLHLTDTGHLPSQTLEFLKKRFNDKGYKVGLVTFDCTFLFREGGETARHMGLPDNKKMQRLLEQKGVCDEHTKYAITHFSHNSDPLKETLARAEAEYGYTPTYDGTAIEF